MAIYTCEMVTRYTFKVKADYIDDAIDWINEHDIDDVEIETSEYEVEYENDVIDIDSDDEDFNGIDISTDEYGNDEERDEDYE